MAWNIVSFKIGNFGTRIWLFEVPWVSFYFNGRLKIAIIANIRSIFNGLASMSFFFRFSLLMLCICWMVRDC